MIKEACVKNINEALAAQALGADRIELCENLKIGGTTPSAGTIAMAKKLLRIPVMVLIRPRGGDFVYSDIEMEVMLHDIDICKKVGVDGVVIGTLNSDGTINLEFLAKLIEAAKPMEITFHKAIDATLDITGEFSKLLNTGVDRLLTSGGKEKASAGQNTINTLHQMAEGKIKIIAAGKIHASGLKELQKILNTDEYHGKKIVGNLNR